MRIVVQHDFDCPLGSLGLVMFSQAVDELANTPPEARTTIADKKALLDAWRHLDSKQVCTCGCDAEIERRKS